MKSLEKYGVESISIQECKNVVGGGFFGDVGYAIGYGLGTGLKILGHIVEKHFGYNPNS
jgi:hypothetical protein